MESKVFTLITSASLLVGWLARYLNRYWMDFDEFFRESQNGLTENELDFGGNLDHCLGQGILLKNSPL